jgi:hypothetical protein
LWSEPLDLINLNRRRHIVTRRFKAPKALVLDAKYRVQKPWLSPKSQRWFLLALLLLGAALVLSGQEPLRVARAEGPVSLSGRLLDSQGEPVRGAEVIVREGQGGKPIAIAESQHDGRNVGRSSSAGHQLCRRRHQL